MAPSSATNFSSEPDETGVSRRERFALMACMFLITATFGFLQPFVPLYMEASGLSREQIGIVTGVGTGLALLVQPLLGRLSDRLDARRLLMIGAALLSAMAYEAYRHAQGWPAFLLLTALGTNGTIYLNAAAAVLVGRLVGRARRGGAAYARFRVWGSIGYIIVAELIGMLLPPQALRGGGRAALDGVFLWGPLLFAGNALVIAFVPDRRASEPLPAPDGSEASPAPEPEKETGHDLRWFLLAYFLYMFALYGASGYLSLYLRELGASPRWITNAFVAGVVCEVLVMRQAGRLSDLWGRRPLMALAFLLLPVRLLLYIPATGPLWVAVVQILHGINFGIMGSVAIVYVNDAARESERGRAQARLAGWGGLSVALGPAVCGLLAQRLGIDAMFGLMASVGVVAAALFLALVHETHAEARSLYERGRGPLRPLLRLLDSPPRRRTDE